MDNHGYPSPPLTPPTMSSSSRLSFSEFRLPFPEVTPSDSISQCGRERGDTTQSHELPTLDNSDHGHTNLIRKTANLFSSQGHQSRSSDFLIVNRMTATLPFNGLPFVKKCERIGHLLHFKLTLNADRELEEKQMKDTFAPLPDDLSKAQGVAREVPGGNRGATGSGANVGGTSDSGVGESTGGPSGQSPPASGDSGVSTGEIEGDFEIFRPYIAPRPHPGRPVEPGDDEYPPGPPSSPEHYRNKFFEIRKSPLAGYGAFARQDLKWGQQILVEPELFHADHVTLYDEFDKLTVGSQQAFKHMSAHCPYAGFDKVTSIFRTNSFNVGGGQAGIFLVAARFNHACSPRNTVSYKFDNDADNHHDKRRIIFTMSQDVAAGTELTITYASCREELYSQWGFLCGCGCIPLSDEEVARLAPGTNWN
ncbi:hypothetical protein PG993_006027 [Apiospora rasikravindrae]|uniref:SET domain-containing protein n=1 Tax=Apiospora rasikravindrae TaxID=990691 RepID=A0ABR1TB27_9PEZI